jgi:hypothetical protein
MKLYVDSNETQSESRMMALDMALTYYKKVIDPYEEAELICDLKLEHNDQIAMAEIKEIADVWGSLPPRGRLGRQAMDMALNSSYAYVGIIGSEDEMLEAAPEFLTKGGNLVLKDDYQDMKNEEIVLRILGAIKSVGVTPLFLSHNPILAYKTLIKYMIKDLTEEPPLALITKPIKNYHAVNLLCNLPGIGWERAEEILKTYGCAYNFLHHAQKCQREDSYGPLESLTINGRKLGKNARKIYEVDQVWQGVKKND